MSSLTELRENVERAVALKLTEAQRRVLKKAPREWTLWSTSWRTPYRSSEPNIFSPTMDVLRREYLVAIDTVPPRWCITSFGEQVLRALESQEQAGG